MARGKEEKLLIIGGGFNSRVMGLFVSAFLLLMLGFEAISLYKMVFLHETEINIGGFILTGTLNGQKSSVSPGLLIVFVFVIFFFLSFSFPYKNISLKDNFLYVYTGNVFWAQRKKIDVNSLREIVFVSKDIKPLLWPAYRILAVQITGRENSVFFPTRIGISKHSQKEVESIVRSFGRDFKNIPGVKILNQVETNDYFL